MCVKSLGVVETTNILHESSIKCCISLPWKKVPLTPQTRKTTAITWYILFATSRYNLVNPSKVEILKEVIPNLLLFIPDTRNKIFLLAAQFFRREGALVDFSLRKLYR